MATDLTELTEQVARNSDVDQSAIALLNGIAARIDAAVAAAEAGNTTALAELATSLRNSSDALAAAITENTDAE